MNTNSKGRIRIYTNVRQSLELAKKIYERHLVEGNESMLSLLEDFSWEATGPKISFCLEKHKEAISLGKQSEEMYRQRDAVLAEITDIVKASKALLNQRLALTPEKLNDWGITINSSAGIIEKIPP
jgi:hypothetical protein